MMRYRLKDRELQRKLDEISEGDFSRALKNERFEFVQRQGSDGRFVRVRFGNRYVGTEWFIRIYVADFREWEFEKAELYDPNSWNRFPEVTPPEDELMRLEVTNPKSLRHTTYCYAAKFKNGEWVKDCTENTVLIGDFDAVRFRPWEDPE